MEIMSVETQIIKATIKALLVHGYLLSVNDGEGTTISRSTDEITIFEAVRTTDEDFLMVHEVGDAPHQGCFGWVRFVYGNDDTEVINDYSINLEPVMFAVNAMIDRYETGEAVT